MQIGFAAVAGALCVLGLITVIGIYASRRIKSAADFSLGEGMKTPMVSGALIGTLIGGASTIGTAQLAFTNGLSAWWFTLGGGIGLAVMAFFFAGPLRDNGAHTVPQILTKEYGKKLATLAAVLMSAGMFISIMSQFISGVALITAVVNVSDLAATGIVVALMIFYVLFGGAWGAGMVGFVKTGLLCAMTALCAIVVLMRADLADLLALPQQQYWNLFSRGVVKDGGAGLSVLFGVLTTQAYFLPVVSAKDLRTARKGCMLGGVVAVAVGIAGILVGLFMRVAMPDTPSALVLPVFAVTYLPGFVAGIILATLLVTLVGSGAGSVLGISTILVMDIYIPFFRPGISGKEQLRVSRASVILLLVLSAVLASGEVGSLILQWSFLSMGLRASVAFFPILFALFFREKLPVRFTFAAVIAAPVATMVSFFLLPGIDPLFPGMAVSLAICLIGCLCKKKTLPEAGISDR